MRLVDRFGIDLAWYQYRAYRRAVDPSPEFGEAGGFLLFHEQGTGKTRTALAVVANRYLKKGVRRLLVVGPLTALDVWGKELAQTSLPHKITRLEGVSTQKLEGLMNKPRQERLTGIDYLRVITVNYEKLRSDKFFKALHRWQPDMMIVDESHRIKSRRSLQFRACRKLGQFVPYKLACTGTPTDQSIIDLWSQFRFACPALLPPWGEFCSRYLRKTGYGYTKWVERKREVEKILPTIHSRMDRVTKSVLGLPPLKHITHYVRLPEEARAMYNDFLLESVAEIEEGNTVYTPNALARTVRLQQLTGGFLPASEMLDDKWKWIHREKLKAVRKIIGRGKKKFVVFARFIPEVKEICKTAEKLDRTVVAIMGEKSLAERQRARKLFLKDPSVTVMVCQIRTGGVGINELVAADTAIMYSTTFSWIDYDQAISRVHRRGQKSRVKIIGLVCRNTIDEDLLEVLQQKKSAADFLMRIRRRSWESRSRRG